MDPITILTVAGMAFTAAQKAYEAGEALGQFINDVKYIDQTISLLVAEVRSLSAACELVGSRIKGIAEAMDGVNTEKEKTVSPLWIQVRTQLEDCGETISALYEAVKDVGLEKKKNPFSQAWRQIQLNMKAKDIDEARNRIRSHTASLQLVLQAITLELSYLGPHRADQQLLVLLENIRDIKKELSEMRHGPQEQGVSETELRHDQKEDELIRYTENIISSGETLYEGSIAGGSVVGPTEGLDEKITSWVSRLQVLTSDTATTAPEDWDARAGSSVSGADIGTMTDITSDSGEARFDQRESDDHDGEEEGDDLEIEMIKEAYELGVLEFQNKDFAKANELLQEVLTMVEESPVRSSRMVDIRELRWMLAVCAHHTDDYQTAEVALKEIVQIPPQGQDDRVRLCEAGHILALASLKQGKLSEARQYCDSALQGRRRLLGKQDRACYESLALLARIFELQDNSARAAIYARMIPEDQREKICQEFTSLGTSAALVGDKKMEAEKELPPLPPGPPPYAPNEPEPVSASSSTSIVMPPEQRWKFRPPIPTAPPPELEEQKHESSDDEPVFPPLATSNTISGIINGSSTFPPEKEGNLARTSTWATSSSPTARPPSSRSQSAKMPAIPAMPQAIPVPVTPFASSQMTVDKAVEVTAYKEEAARASKLYGKKSMQAQNACRLYATSVHEMDIRRPDAQDIHEELLKQLRHTFDDGHPMVYQTYANLAKISESNGDFNKSSDYYQKVLDGMKKNPADDGVFKTTVQSQLAESYMNMEKPDKAYNVLREELKARRKIYGSRLRSAETADAAKRLREVRIAMQASGKGHRHKRRDGDDGASVSSGESRNAGRR